MSRHALWCIAILLAALTGAQSVQAWTNWHEDRAASVATVLERGRLCSVMLANGQIYYGTYTGTAGGHVQLDNVYYVQTSMDPETHQQGNHLVSRRKTDWHAPDWMLIPEDKVVLLEGVGQNSRLAALIGEDGKKSPQ